MQLSYEALSQKHFAAVSKWRSNPEIGIYDQHGFLRPLNGERIDAWCERIMASTDSYTFVVKDEASGAYIGTCALMNVDLKNRLCELAIVIGEPDFWGKGYGKLIMAELCRLAFEQLNVRKLYLHVFGYNQRAIKMYERFGFQLEGTFKEELYRDGAYHDILRYGLFRRDYQTVK